MIMVKIEDLSINDELIYDEKYTVVYLGIKDNKVVIRDPVVGELKILKEIFESNYTVK